MIVADYVTDVQEFQHAITHRTVSTPARHRGLAGRYALFASRL
jgi:hypothetical protein